MMEEKKKRTLLIVSLVMVLALIFGISYAYFLAQDESGTQTITTQNIGVKLDDGTEKEPVLLAEDIKPIDRVDIQTKAVKKNFTVTNTGDEKLFVEISLDDVVLGTDNALQRYDYLWALYEVNGETEKNISIGSFEYASDTVTVGYKEVLSPDESKEYNLYIWIEETHLNQNTMMNQTFTAKVVATGEVYWETPASEFTFDEATGTITGYTGNGGDISIPRVINDVAVTKIGNNAFCVASEYGGCSAGKGITSVIIPNSVTTISDGDDVFSYNQLGEVFIPNSVTSIGYGAFNNAQLTNVIMANGVTSIESNAFYSNQLTSLVLPNSVTSIGRSAFSSNSITNLIIPEGITTIREYAFDSNSLVTVILPSTLETIEGSSLAPNSTLQQIVVVGKSSISDFTGEPTGVDEISNKVIWAP